MKVIARSPATYDGYTKQNIATSPQRNLAQKKQMNLPLS
jgi:hypothetical protein